MLQLILLNVRQVFSKESDVDVEDEVRRSAGVYVKAVEVIDVQKRLDLWGSRRAS